MTDSVSHDRWMRERRARKEAEDLLEAKSLELFEANRQLRDLVNQLEQRVHERTVELRTTAEDFRLEAISRRRAERFQAALYSALGCLSTADSLLSAAPKLMEALGTGLQWQFAGFWVLDPDSEVLRCKATWYEKSFPLGSTFSLETRNSTFNLGEGLPGRVWSSGEPAWIIDVVKDLNYPRAAAAKECGLHCAFAFPILSQSSISIIEIYSTKVMETDEHVLNLTATLGLQIGQFVERKKVEENVRFANARLEATSDLQRDYLAFGANRDIFDAFLARLLNATGCEYGFLGEVHHTEQGLPFLRTLTLSNLDWNRKTLEYYGSHCEKGVEVHNLDTLFGAIITSEEAVLTNDPSEDPLSRELPEGHPPLKSFLGIPLRFSNKTVGAIGLANRSGGFDSTFVKALDPIISTCESVISAIRNERLRNQTDRDLRESKEMFGLLLEAAPEAIVIVDTRGNIVMVNEWARQLFGYNDDEIVGRSVEMLVPASLRKKHEQNRQQFLEAPATRPMGIARELIALTKNGQSFPVEIGLNTIRTQQGLLIISVVNDISEQVALRETMEANLQEERRLNELKSRFVSMASHEFKTPLTAILTSSSYLEVAEGKISGEERKVKLSQIRGSVTRLNVLLDNILSFGRKKGTVAVNPVPHDLAQFIRTAFLDQTNARGGEHKLALEVVPDEVIIFADEVLIQQVFSNLLGNAIKYSPNSSTITVSIQRTANEFVVRISDEGIGVSKEMEELLFVPFQRGRNVKDIAGSGLGLTIVARAIELSGGSVKFERRPGTGSTFVVTLPINPGDGNGQNPDH